MRSKLVAAVVSTLALAMPATAMAAGGSAGGARAGDSGGADQGAPIHTPNVYLARGSGYGHPGGSPLVRALQRRLAAAGFTPGPLDGLYGPRTEAATYRFQAAVGLAVDGIAGPHTLSALSRPTPILYPGAGYGFEASRPVGDLQRMLSRAGYDPGRADGLYGPRTEHAVRQFQAAHRLPVDGIAQPRVFVALRDQIAAGLTSRRAAQPRTAPMTRPATPHPTIATPEPSLPPRPVLTEPTQQPSGGPSIPWVWLLAAALAGTLLVVVVMRTRHRRPVAVAAPTNVAGHVDAQLTRTSPATGENGRDPDKDFRRGVLFEEQNDPAAAEAAYARADEHGHAAAASNLGVLLERRDDLAGAEAAYRRADQRGDPNGAFNLAVLLEEQSDLAGAEAAYRRADERGPAEVANAARRALSSLRASLSGPQSANGRGLNAG